MNCEYQQLSLIHICFGWGVAGAAIATVIAQSFSAVYCFLILRRIDIVHLTRADYLPASSMNARLMKLGIPVVFPNIIIGVGGLVVQYVINGYGFLFCLLYTSCSVFFPFALLMAYLVAEPIPIIAPIA